ncbi:MAG: hypothetical protein KJ787_02690 [Gammaproteobacteria bacterium]|nr:hypothetical protein [Gammaproteobacteria bacterium]MBU1645223.1 hypothetical protein [Gammaproteobacteria bacterium]MBU1973258.1 hypothetical protein [Gammaproteobacteria bacterium]
MNVKLGDVAIIIKGRWPNVGRIIYVARETGDRDYTAMGYGILPSWIVESLGGDLDTDAGPAQRGFTPDISLRRLDLTPEQAKAMRTAKADHDFKAALDELAVVFANYEKSQKQRKRSKERTTADLLA